MNKKLSKSEGYLIEAIDKLPPVGNGFIFKATPDQLKHYQDQKRYWQLIGLGLAAIFSGVSYEMVLEEKLNSQVPKYLKLDIRMWLKFYELLNFGWKEILNVLKPNEYLTYKTPGEAIQYIMQTRAYFDFAECLQPFYKFAPQQLLNDTNNWLKIKGKITAKQNLTKSELESAKRLDKMSKLWTTKEVFDGYEFQEICLRILSKSKDRNLKKIYREYINLRIDSETEHRKSLHSRQKPKGYTWSKRIKRKGKKGGYA